LPPTIEDEPPDPLMLPPLPLGAPPEPADVPPLPEPLSSSSPEDEQPKTITDAIKPRTRLLFI
jgi:hypothetical protein